MRARHRVVRVGIVGAGLRGRLFATALAESPVSDVVAFAEPSGATADAARRDLGLPVVSDHVALLDQFDLDAVIVATPDFAHRDAAVAAARAGRHLLIEKPLDMSVGEAHEIRDAVRDGGATCLVGFENRWNPHIVQAHRAIGDGAIGAHIMTTATLSNTWFVPTTMLSWAARSSPVWFLMPHTIDLVTHLSGRTPVSVTAVASRGVLRARGIDTIDVVHALITLDDGSTASLTSAWTLPDGTDAIVDFRFQVVGTDGAIGADPIHQGLTLVTDRQHARGPLAGRIGTSLVGAPIWMAQEWVACLDRGEALGPGVDQGVLVTEVICALERAYTERRVVTLAEIRDCC
ncbi:MAG: Gfo/Idh/MocA family oxidoreductase [Acidobacteria bacterium]|nr:Gfo/Idh/MocA family oxidoreductase [Acidobacteriota bacterium]